MAVIGIDLGTTNAVMAGIENGRAVALPNAEGTMATPSMVAYNGGTGDLLVGAAAQRQAVSNPAHTIFSIKRFMGRAFSDPALTLDKCFIPYELKALHNGRDILVQLGQGWYAPYDLAALILQKLKYDAERYLNEPVTGAVITVPAYYDHGQRRAVRQAGENAGLTVMRVINEPTAAALAYGIRCPDSRTLAVCHLGGGTFDVSIVEVGEHLVEVKATYGDAHLGGDDFDWQIMAWICETFEAQTGIDLAQDRSARARLREAAEAAKCRLSTVQETTIHLPHIAPWAETAHTVELVLPRIQLESLTQSLLARLKPPCAQALKSAGCHIDEVILIGQQSQMPAVQRTIAEAFGKTPRLALDNVQGVALGAAIQAGILDKDLAQPIPLLIDVTPFPIGLARRNGAMQVLVPRNTVIPCRKEDWFTTAEDAQSSVGIHIYQGDRPQARDNARLGQFDLDGILPAAKGTPKIDVILDIDANGVLMVTLRDRSTGRARCWELGQDATFHLLKDTPAYVNVSTSAPVSSNTNAPTPAMSSAPQRVKPAWHSASTLPETQPGPDVTNSPQEAKPAPNTARSAPETEFPSCSTVITAAQTALKRAEYFLVNPPLANSSQLPHLLSIYVSSVSQALSEQACTATERQTRALQILLDSLEALRAGDTRQTTEGLSDLMSTENNPQACADLGQVLRQIGRDFT